MTALPQKLSVYFDYAHTLLSATNVQVTNANCHKTLGLPNLSNSISHGVHFCPIYDIIKLFCQLQSPEIISQKLVS